MMDDDFSVVSDWFGQNKQFVISHAIRKPGGQHTGRTALRHAVMVVPFGKGRVSQARPGGQYGGALGSAVQQTRHESAAACAEQQLSLRQYRAAAGLAGKTRADGNTTLGVDDICGAGAAIGAHGAGGFLNMH